MALSAGQLLVATTAMSDPNFHRTVIMMLEHNELGSLGVVLNRPTEILVSEALPGWEELAVEPAVVFAGGPVEPAGVLGLALNTDGDFEAAALELGPATVGPVRLFQGYAGWAPGQLEGELAQDAWWVLDANADDALSSDPSELWYVVLGRQSDDRRMLRLWPDDPRSN